MRRTIAAITAATAAMLSLGFAGIAQAEQTVQAEQQFVVPGGVYISEFSTRGTGSDATFKEFIELANRSESTVAIGGLRLVVNLGRQPGQPGQTGQSFEIAQIPSSTWLAPGETYLLASQRFTGPIAPDQLFRTGADIPDELGIVLMTRQGQLLPNGKVVDPAQVLDSVATTRNTWFRSGEPTAPLTEQNVRQRLSIHHVMFTGSNVVDFEKLRATPGRPS